MADFVVLDHLHHIIAIVAVDDPLVLKRPQQSQYEDALLTMAGYRVIRYDNVPEYQQLRQDFLGEQAFSMIDSSSNSVNEIKRKRSYSGRNIKAVS